MINVLVVDDSALVRKILTEIIIKTRGLFLSAVAMDPVFAIDRLKTFKVDVIILDIEMPRMDGLTFLRRLMTSMPTPVIILSSLATKNADVTLQAFEYGAFDVITKPEDILELPELEERLVSTIRQAAGSDVKAKLVRQFKKASAPEALKTIHTMSAFTGRTKTTNKIIVIGSSTGGTTAIQEILSGLPVDIPGIVIVQHMPVQFTEAFAKRLDSLLPFTVKLAESGEQIQSGFVYIAPGDVHCSISASGARSLLKLRDGPRVNYHRPSVSMLFNSVANYAARNAIGIMLTGMGDDGAKAMKMMKEAGSYNIVQDEASSVVWGMPGKAFECGAADVVLPLDRIASEICQVLKRIK
ncbi:MAG: chemotaxis response regulator protein-glutamate methylesterase [Spirochaetales bacterium]|nr:chemotaxis response regulator protein-glutamate methylesterase [Spirochaetales bacterium]